MVEVNLLKSRGRKKSRKLYVEGPMAYEKGVALPWGKTHVKKLVDYAVGRMVVNRIKYARLYGL